MSQIRSGKRDLAWGDPEVNRLALKFADILARETTAGRRVR